MADEDEATEDHGALIKRRLAATQIPDTKKRMTQAQLGKELGLSQSHLNAVLNENAPLNAERAGVAARLFDCRATDLTADPAAYLENHIAIIPAAAKEDWQCLYQVALERRLPRSNFTFFVFRAEQEFNWDEHRGRQQEVLRHKAHYAGCIVLVPLCTKEQFGELMQFAKAFKKPVVVVDHNPPVHGSQMPKNVICVSFSDVVGGTKAGEAVLPRARTRKKEKKDSRALVITGAAEEILSAKLHRGTSFGRVLKQEQIQPEIVPFSDFTKAKTAEVATARLKKALDDNKPYVAVFATSGPMTEGVVTAVSEVYKQKGRELAPLVVGYDDTRLLECGAIVGTVIQNVDRLADETIKQLKLLWRKQPVPEQIVTLSPVFRDAALRAIHRD